MSDRGDNNHNSVICNICDIAYTLPEDGVVGNLPHVLLCNHIFCTDCLRSLEFNKVILCPECKMESSLSEGGVDGLQVDNRIIGLIYTARMNKMKSFRSDIPRHHRLKPSSPVKENIEQASDTEKVKRVVEEALSQASENMAQLKNIHQTLVKGLAMQVRREKVRLLTEVDEAMDRVFSMLQRRKRALLGELTHMEQHFPSSRHVLGSVEERLGSLERAMQQAKQACQFPSLESCNLDQVLETLQAPVDIQSFDLSCLSLGSGLSCVLYPEGLGQSLKAGLRMVTGTPQSLPEEPPPRPQGQGGPNRKPLWHSRTSPGVGRRTLSEQDSPRMMRPARGSSPCPGPASDSAPNVIIEEEQDTETQREQVSPPWVLVSHVVNPNHFYIHYMAERKASVLLSRRINFLCSGERCLFIRNDILKTGGMVFVRWKEGLWCRAVVVEVFQTGQLDAVPRCTVGQLARIRVFFQDYGFSRELTVPRGFFCRQLNKCLRRMNVAVESEMSCWAPQAIKCSLKDIVPIDLVKGWSDEAQEEFRHVVGSAAVKMQVFGEERDVLLVDLKTSWSPGDRSTTDMRLSLREYLVFVKLARFDSPVAGRTVPCRQRPLHFYPPVYPPSNLELNAVVSHINTPAHFYIQLVHNMEYPLLMAKLHECYKAGPSGTGAGLEVFCPALELACVALFDDKQWYRAQVIGLRGGQEVEVRYVDIGNQQIVPVTDLRKIKDEFFSPPAMAIECCLADLAPLEGEDTWSEACTQRFKTLANKRLVTAVATERVPKSRTLPVRLFERRDSSEQMTNMAELLVGEELACFRRGVKSQDSHTSDLDPGPEPYLQLPGSLKDLRVRITHVASPGRFYVQLAESEVQLKRVSELLKREYARTDPQEVEWSADMYCAAYINGVWERGQLCSTVPSSSIAEVMRCDFGNTVELHVDNLRPLLPSLVGSMVLECSLSDIRPAGGHSTWTATACDLISYYLTGATGIMSIKEKADQRPVPVSLFCSNRAGRDVSIADFLVSEGLALKERKPRECSMPRLEEEPVETLVTRTPQLDGSLSESQTSSLS